MVETPSAAEEFLCASGGGLFLGSLLGSVFRVVGLAVCGLGFGTGPFLGEGRFAGVFGADDAEDAREERGEFLAVEEESGFDVVGVLIESEHRCLYSTVFRGKESRRLGRDDYGCEKLT